MAVRKNEQSISRFAVLDTALQLVSYTMQILSNEKVFIPKYQKLIDKMSYETTMIYHSCRVANKTDMRTDNPIEYQYRAKQRLTLEQDALQYCEQLLTDIMISQKVFHLKASKVKHWTKLTSETQKSIEKWCFCFIEIFTYQVLVQSLYLDILVKFLIAVELVVSSIGM